MHALLAVRAWLRSPEGEALITIVEVTARLVANLLEARRGQLAADRQDQAEREQLQTDAPEPELPPGSPPPAPPATEGPSDGDV